MTTTEEIISTAEQCIRTQFDSIQDLLAYIKEIQVFANYETADADEEHVKKYPYQIPLEIWNSETGLQITSYIFRLEFDDGTIFVDRYFDSDYRDYDMPTRYVYIYCGDPY